MAVADPRPGGPMAPRRLWDYLRQFVPGMPLLSPVFVGWLSGIALTLVATSLPDWPSLADDPSALMGRWLVPSREI